MSFSACFSGALFSGKNVYRLKNYIELFHDPVFYQALTNNVLYAVISIVCQVFGGLILAAVLEDKLVRKWSPFFAPFSFAGCHLHDGDRAFV